MILRGIPLANLCPSCIYSTLIKIQKILLCHIHHRTQQEEARSNGTWAALAGPSLSPLECRPGWICGLLQSPQLARQFGSQWNCMWMMYLFFWFAKSDWLWMMADPSIHHPPTPAHSIFFWFCLPKMSCEHYKKIVLFDLSFGPSQIERPFTGLLVGSGHLQLHILVVWTLTNKSSKSVKVVRQNWNK